MTQRGRIEAAQRGVRLNTDAIDNSAGVNTSDLEVNIKIALGGPVRSGALTHARPQRAAHRHDRRGGGAGAAQQLSADARHLACRAHADLTISASRQRLMQTLEARGLLDRAVEFLPDDIEIAERRRRAQALTRPELAVLLAYAKLIAVQRSDRDLGAGRSLSRPELFRYFPAELSQPLSGGAGASSAAARDHRHAAHQFDHQPRRTLADRAHDRRDRRVSRRTSRAPLPPCATATA